MAINRKQHLPFTLQIPEALICMIGHVITQWAYLEAQIDEEIVRLRELPACGGIEISGTGKKARLKWWRAMSMAAYPHSPDQSIIHEIYTRTVKVKRARDQAAHGRWAGKGNTQVRLREKYGQLIGIDDTPAALAEMITVAREIAHINAAHLNLQARVLHILEPSRN
jgi:hypothetical protein